MKKKAKVGSWVRFYKNGVLVIGVVAYIDKDESSGYEEYLTDIGSIREDYVQEVRDIDKK